MDVIFEALAHPHRRRLLDDLRRADGQTLGALEARLPVTRFAVMKHLRLLESAGLVATRKVGREKLHYLNPVPIQLVADRWISRYAAPLVRTMTDIHHHFEGATPVTQDAPRHVYEMLIRASVSSVWDLLTDTARTPLWQRSNMDCRTDWRPGGEITYLVDGHPVIVGEVLEVDAHRRLVHTFDARWAEDVAPERPSRVTWMLEPVGEEVCRLTLIHDDFDGETATSRAVHGGWSESLSRFKTLAETGVPFFLPADAAAERVA